MKNYFPILLFFFLTACTNNDATTRVASKDSTIKDPKTVTTPPLDTAKYNKLMVYLSNGDTTGRWPVKSAPLPLPGAILPFHRIVAYYGNLYSKRMGVLGEYPKDVMIKKLMAEVKKWSAADSLMPAIPALHYIAVTAQGDPGRDGMIPRKNALQTD